MAGTELEQAREELQFWRELARLGKGRKSWTHQGNSYTSQDLVGILEMIKFYSEEVRRLTPARMTFIRVRPV